jgi:hypothetical protein
MLSMMWVAPIESNHSGKAALSSRSAISAAQRKLSVSGMHAGRQE